MRPATTLRFSAERPGRVDGLPTAPLPDADAGVRYEPDGEFLDHARRGEIEDQPELPWED